MTDSSSPTPQSAHDSRPLPWNVLTSEEKNIIDRFNGLLRAIKEENQSKPPPVRWGPKYENYPWALPEWDRRSRVIMLDGPRGVGKTSLLLTMIAGWLKPEDVNGVVFKDMNETVKPLTPLDFDPLPPELPLYSWIIQAFKPLVEKVGGPSQDGDFPDDFPDDVADDGPDKTVHGRFRRLQHSAAVGWTSGLLRYTLGKDLGEFLLWQDQQQLNWQRLQLDWQCFLDELFRHLERSDPALPKNAVIALPIDDLDFQAHRLRELLLALRTLRHERLVYVLTGDVENIDISLKAEFYLSYLRREPTIPEKLRDEIAEQMEKLSLSLREKVIPGPHTFFLKGLPLVEATDWRPTPESPTLGKILDTLWTGKNQEQQETNNEKTLSRFLSQRSEVVRGSSLGDHMLLFRPLQAFFDRWGGKGHERDLNGIVGFLNIAIGRQEEPVQWCALIVMLRGSS